MICLLWKLQENLFQNVSIKSSKIFFFSSISMESSFKKRHVKLELLTDIDMLLMVEKGIGGGLCNSINRYTTVNNKQLKEYDKNKELFYLKYRDVNNSDGWKILQKLPEKYF